MCIRDSVKAGLYGPRGYRQLKLGDGVVVTIRFEIGLGQHLVDPPGIGVGMKHLLVALFGNQHVRAAAMVKNVDVVGL